jgi:hypothetical protein
MTALEYRTALRFRTGHDVLSSIGRCRFCASGHSDTFGFHELSCPGQGRLISRYNALRDCVYSLGQQTGLSVRREPQNLLQDGTGDKPADFLFGSFYHGRDLCVDVTIVNPFTDILKKIRDPDSSCSRQSPTNVEITPIDSEIICGLCSGGIYLPEIKSVLKRIHRGISERSDISYSAAQTRVYQRISFTLQRSNAFFFFLTALELPKKIIEGTLTDCAITALKCSRKIFLSRSSLNFEPSS